MNIDLISQIGLTVFGVTGVILIARKSKWGFVFGLLSQPFWYITAVANHQWGIVVVNLFYTASWLYGMYEWFYKKPTA